MGKARPGYSLSVVIYFLSLFCVAPQVAFAQAVRDLKVSDIFVPPELGYVIHTHAPVAPVGQAAATPIIIHIQEAHTNYEGQQHIVSILEQLIKQHGLTLILVEGGQGDVSLAYLRSFGPVEHRKTVADRYLKDGLISAEEYLDIVSEAPLILWGVEDQALYQRNVDEFLALEALQGEVKPALAIAREAVVALAPRLFEPALRELDAQRAAFDQETLGVGEFAQAVAQLATQQGLAADQMPQVSRFLRVRALEPQLKMAEVGTQQQALVTQLSTRLSTPQAERLKAAALAAKAGTASADQFYATLKELASTAGLSLTAYPLLADYVRYLEDRARIEPTILSQELDQLTDRLRERLAATPESRTLQTIARQVEMLEKLADAQLSPQEYQQLQTLTTDGLAQAWSRFFTEQLSRQGLAPRTFDSLKAVEAALPKLRAFYEAALARDEALVTHTLAKLKETQEPLAVLITGGFHAPEIAARLQAQGVGIVSIAPKITTPTNERLYHAVLKYKSGHGSLEEVRQVPR